MSSDKTGHRWLPQLLAPRAPLVHFKQVEGVFMLLRTYCSVGLFKLFLCCCSQTTLYCLAKSFANESTASLVCRCANTGLPCFGNRGCLKCVAFISWSLWYCKALKLYHLQIILFGRVYKRTVRNPTHPQHTPTISILLWTLV